MIAHVNINLITSKPSANIRLATGSSVQHIYDLLVKDHLTNHTSYHEVKTFNLDEYEGLSSNSPQSYHYYMYEHLFNHININHDNVYIPTPDVYYDKASEIYNIFLRENPLDIQLLGIGTNGHIGFNEPYSSFSSETHRVQLAEQTRKDNARFFSSLEQVPTHAVTMGIKNILQAKKIVLISTGDCKTKNIKE